MKITGSDNVVKAMEEGAKLTEGYSGGVHLHTDNGGMKSVHGATFNKMLSNHTIKAVDINAFPSITYILT